MFSIYIVINILIIPILPKTSFHLILNLTYFSYIPSNFKNKYILKTIQIFFALIKFLIDPTDSFYFALFYVKIPLVKADAKIKKSRIIIVRG